MKIIFVLFLAIQISNQITKDQFDSLYYKLDYFGEVLKILYLPENRICLINNKGLKVIDTKSQNIIYFMTQNIEQIQQIQGNNLLIKNKNEILQIDANTGKLIRKIKPAIQQFKQFIFLDNEFYFLTDNSIFKQSQQNEIEEQKFKHKLNCMMYQTKQKEILISSDPKGQIIQIDKEFNIKTITNKNLRLFNKNDLFDSQNFIVSKENIENNIKQLLNRTFNQLQSNDQYQIQKIQKGFQITDLQNNELFLLNQENLKEKYKKIFTNGNLLIVQTQYLTLNIFDIKKNQLIYTNEESLAEIQQIEFYLDHDTREHLTQFSFYKQLLDQKQFLKAWKLRLQINTQIIKENIQEFQKNLKQIFNSLITLNIQSLKRFFNNHNKSLQTKIAIIQTKSGKLFRYNMKTNQFEKQINIDSKGFILKKYDNKLLKVILENGKINKYYDTNFNIIENHNNDINVLKRYFFKVDKKQNNLIGFFNQKKTWQINFEQDEQIIKYQSMQDTKIPQNSFVIEKNHVVYKLIDPNNLMLITKTKTKTNLYIINTKYGKIIGQYQVNINLNNFQLLVDDNSFFLIYYDNFQHLTEIIHFEIFRNKIEKELMPIIQTSWQQKNQRLEEIDYNAYEKQFFIMQKTYGIDLIVKKVFAFDSANDLTSKNLLILTNSDQLYSIPREILSTRRCLKEEKEKAQKNIQRINLKKIRKENYFKSQILPDYEYLITLSEKDLISSNLELKNLQKIYVSPTVFESTSDLIITGQSFLTLQHSPNQLFDQLPNSFDKVKLLGFLSFLIVVYFGINIWSNNKAKYQYFDTS